MGQAGRRRTRSLKRVTEPAATRPSWDTDDLPQGDEKVAAVQGMFDAIAPKYDRLNRIISFRLDVRWRKRAVRDLALPAGSVVLDLASGTGDLCIDRSGVPRVQTDILRLPVPDAAVDGVTCGFALRNLLDLPTFFDELGRVVRPGGRIALLDVSVPSNRVVRWGNDIYFGKVVPRIGALLSDGAAYRYLPKSVAYLPSPDQMLRSLADAGFADATHAQLSGGLTQLMVATRT